jgi:hypothetical protein
LELLLNEINPRIRKNPSESFSLEVQPLSAGVELVVSGGDIDGAEKNALFYAIQQGLLNYGVPARLNPEGARPGGAIFTVTLTFREQPPVPPVTTALLICKAAFGFSRQGQTLAATTKEIVEFDIPKAVDQTRKFIAENERFFRELTEKLSR